MGKRQVARVDGKVGKSPPRAHANVR